jgi:glutamyl-tRNA(Gln) amidotransferase subunit E
MPVKNAIAEGMKAQCVLLRGFKGLLRWQTQTDTFFSREISDRVRVIACLTTLPNIIHSDSPSETLASSEWQMLKKAVAASDNDTLVLVWGNEIDAKTGAAEIAIRAKEATIGIPSETRQALRDGTNGFERILPGPDRMYPDTDLPPRRIEREHLKSISTKVPRPFYENIQWYNELGIPDDVKDPLSISPHSALFESAVKRWGLHPTLASIALIQLPKRVARHFGQQVSFSSHSMKELLLALKDHVLAREGILPALREMASGREFTRESLPPRCSDAELEETVNKSLNVLSRTKVRHPEKKSEILMGLIMNDLRGRIDGHVVATRIAGMSAEVRP